MELVEKDETSNTPVAKASAKCWKQTWAMVQPYFMRTTGQMLRAGMKVLLKVYPQFHEAYGFSWIVTDIDPTFTLGEVHPGILKNTHYFIVFIYTKLQHYFISLFFHSFMPP